jgi:membrane associated rhomboid family serine protease
VETAMTAVLVIASGAMAGVFGYWTIRTGRNR